MSNEVNIAANLNSEAFRGLAKKQPQPEKDAQNAAREVTPPQPNMSRVAWQKNEEGETKLNLDIYEDRAIMSGPSAVSISRPSSKSFFVSPLDYVKEKVDRFGEAFIATALEKYEGAVRERFTANKLVARLAEMAIGFGLEKLDEDRFSQPKLAEFRGNIRQQMCGENRDKMCQVVEDETRLEVVA